MVYPWWAPKDIDTAMPLIKQRVYDIVNREKGKVGYFDAVNEATSAAAYQQPNAVSEWIERDGAAKVIETVLGWARDADAGAGSMFTYNDFDIGESNVSLITQMQKDGVMPDVIGIQSHMHSGTWPMTELWSVAEKFGSFGKPVHFTETTILSGPNHSHNMDAPDETDWLTTDEGEQTQAAYVAQFYSVLFSHPALRAITWWDFTDKNCWMGAPGGLLRKDMSGKPAYDVLLKLIRHDWWTNASGSTSTDGLWTQHAFYGDYNVTVTDEHGHSTETAISYPEASGPRTVTVRL
jgi:GH35 family endo-1,4-beta-xylanase